MYDLEQYEKCQRHNTYAHKTKGMISMEPILSRGKRDTKSTWQMKPIQQKCKIQKENGLWNKQQIAMLDTKER